MGHRRIFDTLILIEDSTVALPLGGGGEGDTALLILDHTLKQLVPCPLPPRPPPPPIPSPNGSNIRFGVDLRGGGGAGEGRATSNL